MEEPQINNEELAYMAFLLINSNFRIYDTLITLVAGLVGADQAKQLQAMHERGEFLFPPPFLSDDEEEGQ